MYEPLQLLYYGLKIKPDLINGVYTLPKGLNSIFVSFITKTKCIVSVLGGKEEIEPKIFPQPFWKKLNIWQLRKSSAVTTKGLKDNAYINSLGIKTHKIFVYNGFIDVHRFSPFAGTKEIDVIYVGNFYELKGLDRILNVFYNIKKNIPDFKAAMIGNGVDWMKLKQKANDMGMQKNIVFPGFQRKTEDWYRRSKTLILMSRSEGMPNCMLEAMACGCVPVVPDVGNIVEAAINMKNAFVVQKYDDIETYSQHILELLQNKEMRERMAHEARKTVEVNYSLISQSQKFETILQYLNVR
jgi:glycosyltransferase involved in cell wall biosynthesis